MADAISEREGLRSWVQWGTGCNLVHWEGEPEGMGGPVVITIRRGEDVPIDNEVRRVEEEDGDFREDVHASATVSVSIRCQVRNQTAGATAFDVMRALRDRMGLSESASMLQAAGLGRTGRTTLLDTTALERAQDKRVFSGAILETKFNVVRTESAELPTRTFTSVEAEGVTVADDQTVVTGARTIP